jgi:hypothetical protein
LGRRPHTRPRRRAHAEGPLSDDGTQPCPALVRTPDEQAEEDAFLALYGAWEPTGYRREHEDTDVSILACDVPAFVEFMTGRWHVWNNVGGVLHPLGDRWPTVEEPRSQLWLREHAAAPWIVDMPLTPDVDAKWTNKFLVDHVDEVENVTWVAADGIRYLLPEIVLFYKARLRRKKDEPDFEATLPTLTAERRAWMRTALKTVVPDHHWLERL